jgi:hypothetical protein
VTESHWDLEERCRDFHYVKKFTKCLRGKNSQRNIRGFKDGSAGLWQNKVGEKLLVRAGF